MSANRRWALSRKSSRTGLPLWAEIALVLLVKVALLFFLWQAFFSHPQARHMALPTPVVEKHLLSPKPAASRVRHAHQMFVFQIIDVEWCAWRTLPATRFHITFKAPHGSD